MDEEKCYIDLAHGIIEQAVIDYRKCLKKLKRKPLHEEALKEKKKIEKFFRSKWYDCLTDVNPEMLIRKLNEEVM